MAISCDYCGEHHLIGNCPYNPDAYGHMEDHSWNQQQNSSWCDQNAQNFFYQNNFASTADMSWQYNPHQDHSNSLEETFQDFIARPDSLMEFNQLLQQCSNIQEPSNSMDVILVRMDVHLREAEERSRRSTYAMDTMPQQLIHRDTEIPMLEHVDEKCPNEPIQQIATSTVDELGQSNATTTLNEAEKGDASANSKESDAKNSTTMLMRKQESLNCSLSQLPWQSLDYMLDQQDGNTLSIEYEKVFLEEPTLLDLKPSTEGYDSFGYDTQSMVIPLDISATPKSLLMEIIEKFEENGGWMREEFKTYSPSLDLNKILAEDCHVNWLEQQLPRQRRLHPTMLEVDDNETTQRVHAMAISCDYCGEHHSIGNCPYNPDAHGHMEDHSWNQQQNSSWYDQNAQNFFFQNNFASTADMSWQYNPHQDHSNSLEETFQDFMARPDSLMEFNQLPQQCSNIQEPSNSMDVILARMDVHLREAEERSRRSTYAMDTMPQQLIHRDTEIPMLEVKEQCEENSLICEEQLEHVIQKHVDEKCPNEPIQQISTATVEELGQSNATTTLNETEKGDASANSKESDAKNATTTLMRKQESLNCSLSQLPWQSLDYMLDQQDGNTLSIDATPKSLLMEIIEKFEENGGWMREEFKTYSPSLDLNIILAEECHGNWLEQQLPQQRRLHPTMLEVDDNEVIKWLDVDIIFSNNIFMPSRTIVGWRVCMDYKGTRKKDTSTMVTQEGVAEIPLTQLFLGRIVTRWRVRMDYKKYLRKS
ncbi:hypothetical protein GQ457_06G010640 [Hibiscus cannabinus]